MNCGNHHKIKHFPDLGLVKITGTRYTVIVGCATTRRTAKGRVCPAETSPEKERVS